MCIDHTCIRVNTSYVFYVSPHSRGRSLVQILPVTGSAAGPALRPEDRHVVLGLRAGGDAYWGTFVWR